MWSLFKNRLCKRTAILYYQVPIDIERKDGSTGTLTIYCRSEECAYERILDIVRHSNHYMRKDGWVIMSTIIKYRVRWEDRTLDS